MNKFAGLVIDTYDDVDGVIIRSLMDIKDVPDFVKSAERIDPESGSKIPDDNYALILVDQGTKMRKYATVDKGNTALSVMYLLKQAHYLPEAAIKVAANNLIEACERFELEIPNQLKLAASTGISGVSGESQNPFLRQAYNKQVHASMREVNRESEVNPQLGKGDANQDVRKRTNMEPVMGSNFMELPPFSTKERFADSQGTSIDHEKLASDHLTLPMFGADEDTFKLFGPQATTRKRNWRTSPYVDVADWEPGADLMHKQASVKHTLLNGRYPVDSFEQVKLAESYFNEHVTALHPRDRKTYCTKLAARADELGIKVSDAILKYASSEYGSTTPAFVNFRKQFVADELHPVLDTLLEKQAYVKPETFAHALEAFDKFAHIDHLWDAKIPDPWSSTFGDTLEKTADEDWRWDNNGVRVCEGDLENLATNGLHLVKKSFGQKFSEQFREGPKTFFESLPLPNKLVLGRLAMDRTSGTGTE